MVQEKQAIWSLKGYSGFYTLFFAVISYDNITQQCVLFVIRASRDICAASRHLPLTVSC